MLKHLIAYVLMTIILGVMVVSASFLANDLVENKILLGKPLQPIQATLLLVNEDYLETSFEDNELLTENQRKRVRLGVIIGGAIFMLILTAGVAGGWYYNVWIFQQINQRLRVEMLGKAEYLSLKYHSETRTGDAVYRVYQDSATITRILEFIISSPLRIVATILMAFTILTFFSPWLGLLIIAAAVPITLLFKYFIPRVRQAAERARTSNSELTSQIQETLAAIRVIKASGAEARMMERFETNSQVALDAAFEMRKNMSLLVMSVVLISVGAFLVGEYFMATWAMTERTTYLGGVVAFVGFAAWNLGAFKAAVSQGEAATDQTRQLAEIWSIAQDVLIGLKRSFYLLDLKPEIQEIETPTDFPAEIKQVVFTNVWFGYQPDEKILKGINFTATKGTITAIVGGSGAGKSTAMSLLLRLYDPVEGAITLNDINLKNFSISSLRNHVAIALQQNVLFAKSVRDNIAYGLEGVSKADIEEAARVACVDEFVRELPMGYETELGERGGKLSTGQRQRLSIARAILRDSPILILDEPTASLDAETEQRVIKNLSDWGENRVIFIITHRLSTIKNADQIAFLEEGQVKEIGSHDELINEKGPYHQFVEAEQGEQFKTP